MALLNMVKIIFFDIDGTLVSFKTQSIPASAKIAIAQLREKGIKLIIATGRAYCDINNLEDIVFDGIMASNGAFCIDAKGEIIAQQFFDKASMERLAQYMEKKPFSCEFMTEKGNFISYADNNMLYLSSLVNLPLPPTAEVAKIIEQGVFQIGAFVDSNIENELLREVFTDCECSRWHPVFVDFNIKGCNKATGIDKFLAYFGIDRDSAMAFGDGGNDIPMLRHVAIGVAMGNAFDEVKNAADYVTDSVDEDGIKKALKHFNIIS